MNTLENKVIIITGAAMGLGLAAAKELASQKANLTLVDYNQKSLEEAKADISKEFYNCHNAYKENPLTSSISSSETSFPLNLSSMIAGNRPMNHDLMDKNLILSFNI